MKGSIDPDLAMAVVEAMCDAVLLVNGDGEIEAAGEATRDLFGYAPDELVGLSVDVLIPEEARDRHRDHRAGFAADQRPRPMGVGLFLEARCRDGSKLPIDVSLTPFDDDGRVLAVVRDQSDQAAARADRELVVHLLDATTEGVFMFPADTLEFSYVNQGAVRQTGYGRADLLAGMTPLDIKPEFTLDTFRDMIRPLVDAEVEVIAFETVHRRKDGTEVPVDVMLHSPDGAEVPYGYPDSGQVLVALVRDISDRREAEAEHDRHQMNAMADQQRMATLEDRERIAADLHDMVIQRLFFAAGMRLEATGPMTDDPVLTGRLREIVDDLDATIREIRSAIFDLHQPRVEKPPLATVVSDVVTANESYLGFEPELRIEGDLNDVSPQVADQLVPVITEALSNVARHAQASSVAIDLRADRDGVELTITDNGIGLPSTIQHGSGLGNLARRARDLGGDFSAHPCPSGGGTTVRWSVHNAAASTD